MLNLTASSRRAGTWSTRPTSIAEQGRSRSSAAGWPSSRRRSSELAVIATKGRFPTGPGPNDLGLSRRHLSRAIDASLRRLGVDCIDLYQVHGFDPLTPIDETLRALDDAVRMGKVSYVGLSNFTGWQVQKAVDVAQASHLSRPVTLQPQYNLLVREIEWEISPRLPGRGAGPAPVVTARRWLVDRQVPARPVADWRHAPWRRPGARGGGLRAPRPPGADVASTGGC